MDHVLVKKRVAILDGRIVARTYDVEGNQKLGRFAIKLVHFDKLIYRDRYGALASMTERAYPGATWRDAAQYHD